MSTIDRSTPEDWNEASRAIRDKERYTKGRPAPIKSDGSTASYYDLPEEAKVLQALISYKDMNGQIAEIFRETYRYGEASHCDKLRGIKKILFYANAEKERLEKYELPTKDQ